MQCLVVSSTPYTMGLIKDMWTIDNTFCFIIIVTTPAVAAASEADGQMTLSAGVRQR